MWCLVGGKETFIGQGSKSGYLLGILVLEADDSPEPPRTNDGVAFGLLNNPFSQGTHLLTLENEGMGVHRQPGTTMH